MLHEPSAPLAEDALVGYKRRLGVWMFIAYFLFYAGFVGLNLASPESMESTVFMGLNLATAYGFALIVVALIMALIYDGLCRAREAAVRVDAAEGDTN